MNKLYILFLFISALLFTACSHKDDKQPHPAVEEMLAKGENGAIDNLKRQQYIDSAVYVFKNYENDTLTRFLYRRSAVDFFNVGALNKSINLCEKVISLAKESNDSVSICRATYLAGRAYEQKGSIDSALQYYQKAEKLYKVLKDPDLGLVILSKAYIFHNAGEYVFSETEAFKALRLLQEQHKNIEVFRCLTIIALALNEQDNTNDAIYYYKRALSQVEKFKEDGYSENDMESYRILCYSNIGFVYEKAKRYDEAIRQYQKALDSPTVEKKSLLYAKIIDNIAHVEFLKGNRSGVKEKFLEALKIRDSLKDIQGIVTSNLYIGSFYVTANDTVKAVYYFKNAYKGAKKIKNNSDRLIALKELSAISSKNSAVYSREYLALNDSIQKVSLQTRNKFARIEYETDQLKDEKDALVKKNSFIIGVSAVVLLFVAAIFMIYYLNSRNKELMMAQEQQKANEEIYELMFEQQTKVDSARADEKNRIAMELHDGILNNIYAVRLNLEFNNRKSDEHAIEKRKGFIKELQGVESEIRAVSHDLARNAILEQDKGFDAILGFMITSQKNTFDTEFSADIDAAIDWEQMPNTYKVNIYRIVQEALQNINKYAHAAHAVVTVALDEHNSITVTITDDGEGFDTSKASGGIGMRNLKKRTEALNGNLQVQSSPGKGTSIIVQFSM